MSLNINPEIEAGLRALAQLSGLSVEGFLKQMIDERSGLQSPSRRNPDEWAADLTGWRIAFRPTIVIPNQALEREIFT